MTFLVFIAGHLVFARIVETAEPHSALWAVVGSAGTGLWAASFMASILAFARIDVARGAPVWGKVLLVACCGALLMTVPPPPDRPCSRTGTVRPRCCGRGVR
jgi:hypothetical protein